MKDRKDGRRSNRGIKEREEVIGRESWKPVCWVTSTHCLISVQQNRELTRFVRTVLYPSGLGVNCVQRVAVNHIKPQVWEDVAPWGPGVLDHSPATISLWPLPAAGLESRLQALMMCVLIKKNNSQVSFREIVNLTHEERDLKAQAVKRLSFNHSTLFPGLSHTVSEHIFTQQSTTLDPRSSEETRKKFACE